MSDTTPKLKVRGVARHIEDPFSLVVIFNRRPTDDELRDLHDRLREHVGPELSPSAAWPFPKQS